MEDKWVVWCIDPDDNLTDARGPFVGEDEACAEATDIIRMLTYSLPTDTPDENGDVPEDAWECEGELNWWEDEREYCVCLWMAQTGNYSAYAQRIRDLDEWDRKLVLGALAQKKTARIER